MPKALALHAAWVLLFTTQVAREIGGVDMT